MAEIQAMGALLGLNEPAQRQLGNLQARRVWYDIGVSLVVSV